jgi:hypothetical protein
MKTPTKDQVIVYLYIAGGVVAIYFVYKIMAKLGLITTAADKREEQAVNELRTLEYFDPYILTRRPAGYTAIGESKGSMYAELLRNAMRGIGTDEEAIYSVFGKLSSKYNIAELAGYYQVNYSRDLLSDLLNDLNDSEKARLMGIINRLP